VLKPSVRVARVLLWTRAQGVLLDVAAATLAGCALGEVLRHGPLGAGLGAAAGVVLAPRWTAAVAGRALQRGRPVLGRALEAYLEGGGLSLRPRLEAWVAARLVPVWPWQGLLGLALAGAFALAALAWPRTVAPLAPTTASVQLPVLDVTARVEPPRYTGWPEAPGALPQLRALRHSVVHLHVHTNATRVSLGEKGRPEAALVPEGDAVDIAIPLEASRTLRLAVPQGPVVLVELEAVPDEAPRVTLKAPAADRTLTARPDAFPLRASARDDVGVRTLGFRWTLATGQGEGMHFKSGAVPGHGRRGGQTAEATASLDPLALGMRAGDTLVVWAEATDGNLPDGPGVGRSDVRILRWEEAVADFTGTASGGLLPPPPSQLSERELLARTERLVRARPGRQERVRRATELAEVQRHLRESFGFFLQAESQTGPELDVDAAEVSESGDARARRQLAQAVSEMWGAEAELSMGNPAGALAPERAAVKALDAAFGTERLSLRARAPPDKPVDEGRRLSGAQAGLRPGPAPASAQPVRDTRAVEVLARRLLLSAEVGVTAETARALADALWALPSEDGLPLSALAAPLYAARDAAAFNAAARAAAVTLGRWLSPSPEVVPPVSREEAALFARLPLPPVPP
jgi:hypothetical protein